MNTNNKNMSRSVLSDFFAQTNSQSQNLENSNLAQQTVHILYPAYHSVWPTFHNNNHNTTTV